MVRFLGQNQSPNLTPAEVGRSTSDAGGFDDAVGGLPKALT